MLGSRGERPVSRPRGSRWLSRILACSAFSLFVGSASAGVYATRDALEINALDYAMTGPVGAYQEGLTACGLRYKVVRNEGNPFYSGNYNGRPQTLRIEFDRPVAAIGAQVLVSGLAASVESSQGTSIHVSQSGYYGLVAEGGGVQEMTLETSGAPIEIDRIDVRPMPVATADSITVYENSVGNYDGQLILNNDAFVQAVRLESPPLHAEYFELHADGSFFYRPQKDYHGEDSFLYRATNGGGASASSPATVTLYVTPVNGAPHFRMGDRLECDEDCGFQTVKEWATEMAAGPEDEKDQALTWDVQTNRPDLFSVVPSLDADGNLTYQPAPNASGEATVTVRLRDNGGTENGGVDTSESSSFTIYIRPQSDAPTLSAILDCAVLEGDVLRVTARASEVDMDTPVRYSLERAPEGATIDPLSGQISWQPGTGDTGEMREFVVKAIAGGDEALSSTTTFRAEVLGRPQQPVLARIESRSTKPAAAVHFRLGQSDERRYALLSGAKGAVLNPRTGMFFWKAPRVQAAGTYRFSVAAYNPWAPGRKAVQTFAIRVNPDVSLVAKSVTSGQAAMVFAGSRSK